MDLSNITTLETIDVELTNPVSGETLKCDDGSPMTLTLAGPYSKEYKKYFHDLMGSKFLEADAKKKKDEERDVTLEFNVAITMGWNIQENGEKPEFTKKAVKEFYLRHPWVADQIEGVPLDRSGFIKTK